MNLINRFLTFRFYVYFFFSTYFHSFLFELTFKSVCSEHNFYNTRSVWIKTDALQMRRCENVFNTREYKSERKKFLFFFLMAFFFFEIQFNFILFEITWHRRVNYFHHVTPIWSSPRMFHFLETWAHLPIL